MTETVKKPRKARRNFAAEREKLVATCRSRIETFQMCLADPGMPATLGDNFKGQCVAYAEVLRIMGEAQ